MSGFQVHLKDTLSIDQQRSIRTRIESLEGVFKTHADSTATESRIKVSLRPGYASEPIRQELSRMNGVIAIRPTF